MGPIAGFTPLYAQGRKDKDGLSPVFERGKFANHLEYWYSRRTLDESLYECAFDMRTDPDTTTLEEEGTSFKPAEEAVVSSDPSTMAIPPSDLSANSAVETTETAPTAMMPATAKPIRRSFFCLATDAGR